MGIKQPTSDFSRGRIPPPDLNVNTKVRLLFHINKFIFVGYFKYLCGMIKGSNTYLKTKIDDLPRSVINKITKETMKYCIATLGTNPNTNVPPVSVVKRVGSRRYGEYNYMTNKIRIHHNICENVQMMIRTIIHEYTHYIQDIKGKYDILYKKYGYDKHPQEIEARKNEKLYSSCWKIIKNRIT